MKDRLGGLEQSMATPSRSSILHLRSSIFWRRWLPPSPGDTIFHRLCQSAAMLVIALMVLLGVLLFLDARPAIANLGWRFLIRNDWNTVTGDYGALAFIFGSVVTSILAMVIAVPLGVGTATFLAEIAPGWLRRTGSFLVELLAAIPSVVYGFWGVNFLAPDVQALFNWTGGAPIGGKCILSAGLILAIMIVPYVSAVAYDVCRAVPRSQREGALALGATRWQMIWGVVLPYARPGIVGGCFLALGRAVGETMAVTMLIGNTPVIESLPFGRGYTIPSVIAQELPATSSRLHEAALIELSLVLFLVTVGINILARLLIWRVGRIGGRPHHRPHLPLYLRTTPGEDNEGAKGKGHPATTFERVDQAQPSTVDSVPDAPDTAARQLRLRALRANKVMTGLLGLCLAITLGPLFLIIGYITYRGLGALSWEFFVNLPKPMGQPGGGLANALYGSLMVVGLATAFAVPVGILSAILLAEFRNRRFATAVRFVGELLNGVPSIVIGTFVYALVHVFIQAGWLAPAHQFSGWAGAFALSVMMIPILMRASEESLKLVPGSLRNASHALGAYHWQTVLKVTVPAALPAIITGVFLAIARIAGETAPLLMTAFGNLDWPASPADKTPALPLFIYKYSMSGNEEWERQAWAAALVLLAFVMLLNVGIRFLTGRRSVSASRAE
jgi:phosphate transport system permease protein